MYCRQSFHNDNGTMAGRAHESFVSAFMQRRSLGIKDEEFDEDVFRLPLMVPKPTTHYILCRESSHQIIIIDDIDIGIVK